MRLRRAREVRCASRGERIPSRGAGGTRAGRSSCISPEALPDSSLSVSAARYSAGSAERVLLPLGGELVPGVNRVKGVIDPRVCRFAKFANAAAECMLLPDLEDLLPSAIPSSRLWTRVPVRRRLVPECLATRTLCQRVPSRRAASPGHVVDPLESAQTLRELDRAAALTSAPSRSVPSGSICPRASGATGSPAWSS